MAMRRTTRLHVFSLLALLMPSLAFLGVAAAEDAAQPRVVKEERLGPNFVRITWSNGVVYVGEPGVELQMNEWTAADGKSGTGSLSIVSTTGPKSMAEISRAAQSYRQSGRSVAQTLRALREARPDVVSEEDIVQAEMTTQAAGDIWTSNCATSANTTKVYVYACTWRYEVTDTDPAKWYSGDQSQVIGRAKTGYYLGELGMTHNYGSASSAFGFSPGSDVQQSSCTSLTFGLNGRGISVEATFPICPTILDVTSYARSYEVLWQGGASAGAQREVWAHNFLSTTEGKLDYMNSFASWSWGNA